MTKLTIHADCGNAPKKLVLRDLNIAFAHSDVEAIFDHLTDDIRWQIIGEADLHGKEAVRAAFKAMKDTATSELIIHSIITRYTEAGKENQYGLFANRFGTKTFQA